MARSVPLFSVIVPAHDRPESLALCLQALASQDYARAGYEVVVVDDGSNPPIREATGVVPGELELTWIEQGQAGPAAARNAGAARARGRYLVFTDDDCLPGPDWLCGFEARFRETPDHAVGGPTANPLPDNPYACASQVILDLVYAHYNDPPGEARFPASNNLAVPAEGFRGMGGFDGGFSLAGGEDRDFSARWRESGRGMAFVPGLAVIHAHPLTLRRFVGQHLNYGRGAYWFHRARASRTTGRFRFEGGFYVRSLGLVPGALTPVPCGRQTQILALLLLWRLANAVGFARELAADLASKYLRRGYGSARAFPETGRDT
jgi:GT2 family glycosyltransferase